MAGTTRQIPVGLTGAQLFSKLVRKIVLLIGEDSFAAADRGPLLAVLGHMHESGARFTLELERGGEKRMLYEVPEWRVDFRDAPPIKRFEGAPLELLPGDRLTMSCGFNNTGAEELSFPQEMCSSVAYYAPALPDALVLCIK